MSQIQTKNTSRTYTPAECPMRSLPIVNVDDARSPLMPPPLLPRPYEQIHNMSPNLAQKIVHESLFYDTPMIMLLGTQIALFKVYGIPSIASLLLKTGELTSKERMNKRLADTGILITTAISNPILGPRSGVENPPPLADPRSAIAIARMNYLHGMYKINNDDFLYNLALFMIEPIRWTAKFDWRPHSPVEIQAIFVLWAEVGRRMGMENVWNTYDEMVEWTNAYESTNMIPSDPSETLANLTINHFLNRVPTLFGLRKLARQLVLSVLDEHTRKAMRMPPPNPYISSLIYYLFKSRAFIVRHFCLPRRKPALWVQLDMSSVSVDSAGMMRMHSFYPRRAGPYYYPERTGFALFLQNIKIAQGRLNPETVPGEKWRCRGYRLEELGPERWEHEGHEKVIREAGELQGCPISGVWGLTGQGCPSGGISGS
ncbi:hypothetical protein BDQ17DRAFT_1434387 [Cyathus striatus]|nr:hypothetical protein BDQ17DRAFT_1434387 [Cyathus striatus]